MNNITISDDGQMMAQNSTTMPGTQRDDELKRMYPDIYKTMYLVIQTVIDEWINSHPFANKVTEDDMNTMSEKVLSVLGIVEEPAAASEATAEVFRPIGGGPGRPFHGRGAPFRDLSRIFLINALLGRRNPYSYYRYCDPYDPYCPYYY